MISALLAAVALLLWPGPTAGRRLAELTPKHTKRPPRPTRWLPAVAFAVLVPLVGPVGAIAAGIVWLAYRTQRRARANTATKIAHAHAMAEALRTTVAELRTGAPPSLAAEAAAADAPPETAEVMKALAVSARFGGELAASESHGLAKAWSLSRRHGLPLTELLDAVRRDVTAGARFTSRADAMMAGPRASAAVLAGLPGLGLVFGEALGAAPLHVLRGTIAGQVLLVLGAALILAGVAWSARLTSAGVPG